jgi:hypothetical protein
MGPKSKNNTISGAAIGRVLDDNTAKRYTGLQSGLYGFAEWFIRVCRVVFRFKQPILNVILNFKYTKVYIK